MSAIDYGARLASAAPRLPLLQRLNPSLRLAVCLGFALAMVSLHRLGPLVAGLAMAIGTARLARLDPWPTLKRMAAMDGFMVFVIGFLPFTLPGQPAFAVMGLSVSFEGLHRAAAILLAANAVGLAILALIGTLQEPELGAAFRGLHVPQKLTQLLLLTLRYIDVLRREYQRLRLSMKVRGFRMGCNRHSWVTIGYLFGMLLVRSIERSERILIAMRCRGYRGVLPELAQTRRLSAVDLAAGAGCALGFLALLVFDRA